MADGTGLTHFKYRYPERFFDVGIAEGHAVTFAAGLAAGGMRPVVAVYSSFLQRGYDQIVHDVALQKLPVVFAVDRAGLVGSDGETHQGILDLSFLSSVPNMVVMSPKHKWELADMLHFALCYDKGPVAIRYPRGTACDIHEEFCEPIVYGKSEVIFRDKDIAILAVGHMYESAVQVRESLISQGYHCSLLNARFVKPIDQEMIMQLSSDHRLIVTIEENVRSGGYGEHVAAYIVQENLDIRILTLSLPDQFIEHGDVTILREKTGLNVESMTEKIIRCLYNIIKTKDIGRVQI